MTRHELIAKVRQTTGLTCHPHHIEYLRKTGRLGNIPKQFGWREYSDEHAELLAKYLQSNPRNGRGRRKVSAA
jgi:hypothetical protein